MAHVSNDVVRTLARSEQCLKFFGLPVCERTVYFLSIARVETVASLELKAMHPQLMFIVVLTMRQA